MSTKFSCRFCKEQFDVPKALYKHLQSFHNAGVSRDNKNCPICGVLCSKYESYRDHLLYIHGQTDDGQKLTFKSLNDFLVWKTELEMKHNCKYVLQTSPKVLPTKEKKYFYQCDRSNSKLKDKKSSVVMKTCSSVISVLEGAGIFKVEYWDTHSGHEEASFSVEKELEAAISSVEMVNAIGDSDDDFDRSGELVVPENSNAEKRTFFMKTNPTTSTNNLSNSVSNIFQKNKATPSPGKIDPTKKKTNNTSILFSLASVACGKGIKRPASTDDKNASNKSILKLGLNMNSKTISKTANKNSTSSEKQKGTEDLASEESLAVVVPEQSPVKSTTLTTTTSATTKTTPSGPPLIAPKPTTITSNSINSLFTSNSPLSNQFVIMDQNSLNSGQNVFTAGQNIVLSLGQLGQKVPDVASQIISQNLASEQKKSVSSSNTKVTKGDSSSKINKSNAFTPVKNSLKSAQSVSSTISSTITSTMANNSITLTSGLNNTPVILSSLPVGSTFMSLNNNLIPIASPSGAFIPTSLPPNIVLTPVVPGTSLPNMDSSKSATSSASTVSCTPQLRLSTPSTAAITVSSIVKEPLYTSSPIKQMSNIVTSNNSPLTSTPTSKISKQRSSKFVPITCAGRVSPVKTADKSSSLPKTASNINKSKNSSISFTDEISLVSTNKYTNKANLTSNSSLPVISAVGSASGLQVSSPSARKRIAKGTKSKSAPSPIVAAGSDNSSAFNTKVVNSRLHLTPISSTPNVTVSPQLNTQKSGTMLFESAAGEIYMLEPVENDNESSALGRNMPISSQFPKIKIDRAMQTVESSGLASFKKLSNKRAASPSDDSSVMLKVKCFQLEMKCLNSQAECKRLKIQLTKERLKNAELSGKKALSNSEEDSLNESSNTSAVEIMKDIDEKFSDTKDGNIYTMTKTSVLRSLYEDLEELCVENSQLYKELENYRAHDKFYKNLKKKLHDEEF